MNQQYIELLGKLKICWQVQEHLPSVRKKKLQQFSYQLEVVVVDVTETPIERPKKNKNSSTVAKRKDIH